MGEIAVIKNEELINYSFSVDEHLGEMAVNIEELKDAYDVLNYTVKQLEKVETEMEIIAFYEYKQLKVMRSALHHTFHRLSRLFEVMNEGNEEIIYSASEDEEEEYINKEVLKRFVGILERNVI